MRHSDVRRGGDGLLHITGQAHNRLQVLIQDWMQECVPSTEELPIYGNGTISEVSCRAANAAAESVASSMELLGCFNEHD